MIRRHHGRRQQLASERLSNRGRHGILDYQPQCMVKHIADSQIDPQDLSPLFNGHIPTEIREMIFFYALTPHSVPNVEDSIQSDTPSGSLALRGDHLVDPVSRSCEYPTDTHYTRPGYTHRTTLSVALLRTCKLAYLALNHLPVAMKEHVFWHERAPEGSYNYAEINYLSRFNPETLARVKELHLFTQQYWLEGSFSRLCNAAQMQGIEKITITIRRGDWWNWEGNSELGLNPHAGNADVNGMKAVWRQMDNGEEPRWSAYGWAGSLQFLTSLKELQLELETSSEKKVELEQIVRNARKWKFPMGPRGFLTTGAELSHGKTKANAEEKNDVQWMTWQGPPCMFSNQCPVCGASGGDCEMCRERANYRNRGLGPMLIMTALNFKLSDSATGGETVDYMSNAL